MIDYVIIFVTWFVIVPFCIWSIRCSAKTPKDRIKWYNEGRITFAQWESVDFNAHWWHLMTFRNPMKLYHD